MRRVLHLDVSTLWVVFTSRRSRSHMTGSGGKPKPYLRRVTPKAPRLLKTTHRAETSRWRTLFTRLHVQSYVLKPNWCMWTCKYKKCINIHLYVDTYVRTFNFYENIGCSVCEQLYTILHSMIRDIDQFSALIYQVDDYYTNIKR